VRADQQSADQSRSKLIKQSSSNKAHQKSAAVWGWGATLRVAGAAGARSTRRWREVALLARHACVTVVGHPERRRHPVTGRRRIWIL